MNARKKDKEKEKREMVEAILFANVELMHHRFGLEFVVQATWQFSVVYNDKGGLQGAAMEAVKKELRTLREPDAGKVNHFKVQLTDKGGTSMYHLTMSQRMKFAQAVIDVAEELRYGCILSFYI